MCGVGGSTIQECKESLSWSEYLVWLKFRQKYGSLHQGMRVDRAVARAASFFGNAMSKRGGLRPEDFSPYDAAIEEDREVSNEEAFSFLASMAKGK